jgi:hypothetical protein
MTVRRSWQVRVYRGLLRLYPATFRDRFSDDAAQLFGDQLRDAESAGGPGGVFTFWLRTLRDVVATAAAERIDDRSVAHSLSTPPSILSRSLGLLGIVGGALLVAAFIPNFPWGSNELFNLRLTVFNAGAIAVIVAVHQRQARVAPRLALIAAIPALLANAWYLVMILLAIGRPSPFAGEFGLVFFWAGAAMWWADAWFALVTARLRAVSRSAAIVLAVGSALAFLGMDRLELVNGPYGSIVVPLALIGIALNGVGWILLGIDVMVRRLRRRPADGPPSPQRGS